MIATLTGEIKAISLDRAVVEVGGVPLGVTDDLHVLDAAADRLTDWCCVLKHRSRW